MVARLLLSLQAITGPVLDPSSCERSGSAIVVCGQAADPARYRLPALPSTFETAGPPRAEWGIGGGARAGIAVSQGPTIQGVPSNRVMATIKLPF